MSPVVAAVATVALLALSAFFVAVEFSLMAARPHRLEERALTDRSARAALRSSTELTVVLAGCQLGITVCTLALGAVTKPAVHDTLVGPLGALGMPAAVADVLAFVLALVLVTFLHLVVGEMAPKSWAIARPERSATLLGLPMRAFMRVTRPVLVLLDDAATGMVRRCGVDPDGEGGGRSPDELRRLVEHSAEVGSLDRRHASRITAALAMSEATVGGVVLDRPETSVDACGTAADVRAATQRTGHLRVLVRERSGEDGPGRVLGVVHVRDTLAVPDAEPVRGLVRDVLHLSAGSSLHEALVRMQRTRTHLALVEEAGRVRGVVTLDDVLRLVVPTGRAPRDPGPAT